MALLAAIIVTATLFEDNHLLALRLGDNFGRNSNLGGISERIAFAGKQYVAQGYGVTGFASKLFNRDLVSGSNPVLFAACAHNCEHGDFTFNLNAVPTPRRNRRDRVTTNSGPPERWRPLRDGGGQVNGEVTRNGFKWVNLACFCGKRWYHGIARAKNPTMTLDRRCLLSGTTAIAMAALLSGCASSKAIYPSLAIRDGERVQATFTSNAQQQIQPERASPSNDMAARLLELQATASRAHQMFLDAAPGATALVIGASNAALASARWSDAQVALADLESARSQVAVPLGDLDLMFVDAALAFEQREAIDTARNKVIAILDEEDRVLAELRAKMPT